MRDMIKMQYSASMISRSICVAADDRTSFILWLSSREGNGTPLQYFCLENPMDGGAWWAAISGVAQSRTWLKRLHFHFSLSCAEGNGNPLQCSCLENPRDGRAWWAAIYGVTQSQTQLKWLRSSSNAMYYLCRVLKREKIKMVRITFWLSGC